MREVVDPGGDHLRGAAVRVMPVVAGTGRGLPERILTNAELEQMVDTSDEWIVTRTGIRERRICAAGQTASDLACEASQRALADAGRSPADLDLILVATVTGDMPVPATACLLQRRLGAANAAAMDINAGCSGFVYALATAARFVTAGPQRCILVVGVDVLSSLVDWADRSTCVLFGDGAGAAVIVDEPATTPDARGVLATRIGADGTGADNLFVAAGGSACPASAGTVAAGLHHLRMNGPAVFRTAVRHMTSTVNRLLDDAGLIRDDVHLLIPHQANRRIIDAAGRQLGFPPDRVMTNVDRYGNTSAASVAIALDEARRDQRAGPGDVVALVAVGAGMTWGGCLIRL